MKNVASRKWIIAGGAGVGTLLLVGALLLTGVLPGIAGRVHASGTGGGVCDLAQMHSVCTGNGVDASAAFYTNDGCLSTEVFVMAGQNISRSAGDSSVSNQVFVELNQYNACDFSTSIYAEGQLSSVDFQGDSQLSTATLHATVPLSGEGLPDGYSLTFDLTWHGMGDTTNFADHFQVRSSSGMSITHSSSSVRSAIATGTVSDGTTNFASDPSLNSSLSSSKGAQIRIDHP